MNTKAEEVSLDLVVRDRQGRPVLDLKPEEIAVTDNGAPVTLTGLRLVNGKTLTEHLITLVFDRLDPMLTKNARENAAEVLKKVPEKGFSIAVLHIDGRLRLVQGFTSDRKALEAAINAATDPAKPARGTTVGPVEQQLIEESRGGADSSGKAVSARDRALAQALLSALEDSGRIVQEQHAQPSLAGLLALARSQQRIAERKIVIFLTQDRQMDSRAGGMIASVIGAANRADVSIFSIDLNALDQSARQQFSIAVNAGAFNSSGGSLVTPGGGSIALPSVPLISQPQSFGVEYLNDRDRDKSPVQNLAEATGGSFIGGEDNLRKPLEQMIEDLTTYYEASYVPSIQEYDGKFRSIGVRPLRPGLKIRSRAGYFALPPGAGADTRPFELPLLKILSEAKLPVDLALRAAIVRLGDLGNGGVNTLVVEAPLSDVEIREDSSTRLYAAQLAVVAQIKDRNGTVVEHFSEDISRRGALEGVGTARAGVITLQRHFTAAPGQYVLEAAIRDRNSGKAGAERVVFDIPNPASGPSISDMVLVRRLEPFQVDADPAEPLRHANEKVMSNLSGQVEKDAKEVSVFFILHPDPHAQDAGAFTVQVLKNGKPLERTPPPPRQVSGTAAVSYLVSYATISMTDGLYEVKATLSQGGKVAVSSVSFTLAAGREGSGESEAADANLPPPSIEGHPTGPLAIRFPATPIQRPAADELKSILADAGERALAYSASLPNFICVEVTNRSVDPDGKGRWEHKDTITEMLTYRENVESRTTLELNGRVSSEDRAVLQGALSSGEFGGMLKSVFQPSSKAGFEWKETGALGEGTVQVFDYRVAREYSSFNLDAGNGHYVTTGFHGQIFVDTATRSVRRITMVAEDLPLQFPIHTTSISVDYDYVAINGHDYLFPIGGQVALRQGKRQGVVNDIEFRDYRHFGSTVKIIESPSEGKP